MGGILPPDFHTAVYRLSFYFHFRPIPTLSAVLCTALGFSPPYSLLTHHLPLSCSPLFLPFLSLFLPHWNCSRFVFWNFLSAFSFYSFLEFPTCTHLHCISLVFHTAPGRRSLDLSFLFLSWVTCTWVSFLTHLGSPLGGGRTTCLSLSGSLSSFSGEALGFWRNFSHTGISLFTGFSHRFWDGVLGFLSLGSCFL